MPSLRSSTIAARRHRIVSGENGSVNGVPFALRSGSPSRKTRYYPGVDSTVRPTASRRRMNSRTSLLIWDRYMRAGNEHA
jgi:hypothetical protein